MLNKLKPMFLGLVFGAATLLFAAEQSALLTAHSNELVVLQGEKLVPADATKLTTAPLTIVYFGAGWCPDCRRFSPKLVQAYNAQGSDKKFEVLFVSRDKTEEGMLKFMKTENMPWPALQFSKSAAAEDLKKLYSGKGIPCLTVVDLKGNIVAQSSSDQDATNVLSGVLKQ